ncbi:MAG: NADH-quinone oxidoreductase subunit NuoE [Candidatus Aminicenantes bacterium]|nr:NADH-quinone oxidoreductase subunit NuoE [Candidatus Aminicenantes bacterium]
MSPEFSVQTKKKIEEVIACYPQKNAALLPVLHLAQQEFGRISQTEENLIASLLDLKPIQVREVVTFYTMFIRKPVGKYHLQVCSNIACSIMGAENLIDYLKEKLGVEIGETTPDQKFTLTTVECLGACEHAPCMMINFDYYGDLDKDKIDKILDGLE